MSLADSAYDDRSVAIGSLALENQNGTANSHNTAVGYNSGNDITNGYQNCLFGYGAGDSLATGYTNTIVGYESDASATGGINQTVIGASVTGVGNNSVTLGNASVTDVYMAQDSQAYVHSQNVPNHVANTMPAPYYRFDGADDKITVTDNAAIRFGTGNFTISGVVNIVDPTVALNFWITKSSTSPYWVVGTYDTSGKLCFYGDTIGAFYADSQTIPANTDVHFAVVRDGAGCYLYQNGVQVAFDDDRFSSEDYGSGDDILIGAERSSSPRRFVNMSDSSMRLFNTALSATEVKELYSGASVPFKYKGANQTASYTSDFSSGVDSWAAVRSTAAGNIDSIGGQNDTLRVTIDGSSGTDHYVRRAGSGMTVGKSYRAKFDYYIPSGNSVVDQISVAGAGNEITIQYLGTTDSWVTKTIDFDNPYNTAVQDFPIIFSGATGGSNVLSGTSAQNDVFYIKNFTFTPIGAVAEYDGSGITNTKWYDKSGNELHGTVSGATDENTAGAPVVSENHPAFLVRPTSNQLNIAADDSFATIAFGTEVFDQGDNFASNTFTAPVTGKYQLNVNIYLHNIDSLSGYYDIKVLTSNRSYFTIFDPDFGQDAQYWHLNHSVLVDMDVNDTVSILIRQASGTAQTDIDVTSNFSGFLVC
jgi:hypothetical protein